MIGFVRSGLACAALAATMLAGAPAVGAEPARRYAVIVANNQAVDDELAPLAYAVDDGAKYDELFRASGAQTALLAEFGPDAARRYPLAAASARPPRRAEVLGALERVFAQIRLDAQAGRETHFYFVYTGHGGLGPNREGYLNLADGRFGRTEFYRQVLARSPATYNHVVLDACYAYFLVLKRGDAEREGDFRAAVRDFLRAEELASYPNTGVILASSASSETHEWSQWEAGIFSHELRSGLLGPADVDGDGAVSYPEAASFVEAANAAIEVPRARLRVFYRPALVRPDLPLFELAALRALPTMEIEPENAGRFHVEDARGVRVADFHPSREQTVRVALLGTAPFWLRTPEREALLPEGERVAFAGLEFRPLSAPAKGSVELTFRRNLFQIPFGLSFFRGATAERDRLAEELRLRQSAPPARSTAAIGWGLVGGAATLGAASGVAYLMANWAYDRYDHAAVYHDARRYRGMTEDRLLASRILVGVAGVAAAAGITLLVIDGSEDRSLALGVAPGPSGAAAAVSGTW